MHFPHKYLAIIVTLTFCVALASPSWPNLRQHRQRQQQRHHGISVPRINRYTYRVIGPVQQQPQQQQQKQHQQQQQQERPLPIVPRQGPTSVGSKNTSSDPCSNPQLFTNFDNRQYAGRWYAYRQRPSFFSPPGSKCTATTYQDDGNGGLTVRNSQLMSNGRYTEICGVASAVDPANLPGQLRVQLGPFPGGDYWLLDTDYTSYAAVYSCTDGQVGFGWMLTRQQQPDQQTIDKVADAFTNAGIDVSAFEFVPQGDEGQCFYEPRDGPSCSGL